MSGAPHPPTRTVPTHEGYDLWSSSYDSDGNPLIALEERIVLPLIGGERAVRGLRVLDVGCGTGRHTLRLAAQGARVTGIDFSSGMLAAARAKPGAAGVEWIAHDLGDAARDWPVPVGAFDLVTCALVLDHVHDVPAFFRQLARAAKPGGRIIVTVMHPAMMLRGVQARFTDEATGERVMPRSAPNQISDYVLGALGAGLRLDHLSEHAADDALVRVSARAEKHVGWPLLLVMGMGT